MLQTLAALFSFLFLLFFFASHLCLSLSLPLETAKKSMELPARKLTKLKEHRVVHGHGQPKLACVPLDLHRIDNNSVLLVFYSNIQWPPLPFAFAYAYAYAQHSTRRRMEVVDLLRLQCSCAARDHARFFWMLARSRVSRLGLSGKVCRQADYWVFHFHFLPFSVAM
ncbi:hypothetical protein SORBI_3003G146450 [Sorghum bicolor]|uniref:Secreted protein n=1 Tax=Sorghum bicolor TaxID=4558 RepID=A0A1B6Q386_SORBI|nr:hypothetical protein SORBI_3003G146450 [Sorghum bicolor]